MRYLIIANPVSGRGRGRKAIPTIETELRALSLDFDLVRTERPWHAAELAEQAAKDGCDVVVAAGGDGTVNEVLNGLMGADDGGKRPALGILGIGTGNDTAFSMGLPTNLNAACQALAKDLRRRMDIGLMKGCNVPQGRYFGNCIGIGFDAAGGILAEKITWAGGFLAYLIAALQNIFLYYKAPTLEIQFDDETITIPSLLVSIMNGQRIGGGFLTAPEALPDDGAFDLCIAEEVSRPRMVTLLPHFIRGTQATQPEIRMARARKVIVNALKGSMPVQIDGEIICAEGKKLSVEILPGQLEIVGAGG
ncbi:MAG: diacylglycerol kinase family lipid kinase [Chloroflexi bacterium]|nr:diacylglycerol kinase family lipid kinase [Chloroflexota bacterium]